MRTNVFADVNQTPQQCVLVKPHTESVFDGNIIRVKKQETAGKDLLLKIN